MSDAPAIAITAATPADAQSLAVLHAAAFEEGWSADALRDLMRLDGSLPLLACHAASGRLVGFLIGQSAADEGEILTVAVHPECRRHGTGRHLVEALLEAFVRAGVVVVHLEVDAGNAAAIALYEATGFTISGRRKGYYVRTDGRHDALVMTRALT